MLKVIDEKKEQKQRYFRVLRQFTLIVFAWISINPSVLAQTCGTEYVVRSGDSLSRIAGVTYNDIQKWTVIYNVNLRRIGNDPNFIQIGQALRVPCLETSSEGANQSLAEIPTNTSAQSGRKDSDSSDEDDAALSKATGEGQSQDRPGRTAADGAVIRLLTGNDYAPFTDQSLPDQGLITDIVATALSASPEQPAFEIGWVDDWSLHLKDLLTNLEYDIGFPWFKPDCVSTPEEYRCQNFNFSNPVFEMPILLFTHRDRPLIFNADKDIHGSVLCRPNGYFTHDLEKNGRLWLTNNIIELKQPSTIKECFDLLTAGTVDAVALNEFTR